MEEKRSETPPAEAGEEKIDALVLFSYIGPFFLVPLLAQKDNEFAQFHAKQGMVLFIAELLTLFSLWVLGVLVFVPVLGWIISTLGGFVIFLIWVGWMVLSVLGIVNVVKGKREQLPFIGQFADRFRV